MTKKRKNTAASKNKASFMKRNLEEMYLDIFKSNSFDLPKKNISPPLSSQFVTKTYTTYGMYEDPSL